MLLVAVTYLWIGEITLGHPVFSIYGLDPSSVSLRTFPCDPFLFCDCFNNLCMTWWKSFENLRLNTFHKAINLSARGYADISWMRRGRIYSTMNRGTCSTRASVCNKWRLPKACETCDRFCVQSVVMWELSCDGWFTRRLCGLERIGDIWTSHSLSKSFCLFL